MHFISINISRTHYLLLQPSVRPVPPQVISWKHMLWKIMLIFKINLISLSMWNSNVILTCICQIPYSSGQKLSQQRKATDSLTQVFVKRAIDLCWFKCLKNIDSWPGNYRYWVKLWDFSSLLFFTLLTSFWCTVCQYQCWNIPLPFSTTCNYELFKTYH